MIGAVEQPVELTGNIQLTEVRPEKCFLPKCTELIITMKIPQTADSKEFLFQTKMIIFPQFKKYDESLKHGYSEGHLIHSLSKQAATKFNLNIESLVELKQSGVQDCLGLGCGKLLNPEVQLI